jgi:hypothetical protein
MNDNHVVAAAPDYPKFNFDEPPILEPDEELTARRLREGLLNTNELIPLREGGP